MAANRARSTASTMCVEPRSWKWVRRDAAADGERMDQAPYNLDQIRRDAVLEAIQEVCRQRGWSLLAVHVRSNHVHAVVQAEVPPERVMNDFKAYASRRLNRMRLDQPDRKRWARHGSTRFLWKPEHVSTVSTSSTSRVMRCRCSSLPYFSAHVRHPLANARGSVSPPRIVNFDLRAQF
jgi:REP element-mobilizing transposase RayT